MADRNGRPDGKKLISDRSDRTETRERKKRRPNFMALEPRVMYDGAAKATVDHDVAIGGIAPAAAQAAFSATPAVSDAAPPTPPPPPSAPAPVTDAGPTSGSDKTTDNHTTVQADAGSGGSTTTPHDIVFIDGSVPDLQTLVDAVKPGDSVYILTAGSDGVQQIADVIAQNGLHDLSSIQIVSHGNQGEMQLGSTVLTNADMASYSAALAQIGAALKPGGDILLYGCDVGSGASGQQFLSNLSTLTGGAHVAASTNPTGAAALGGDWTLEATTGTIDASSAFDASALALYPDLLTNNTLTVTQSTAGGTEIDPNGTDIVTTTVLITNNSPDTDALNVALQETLSGLTPNTVFDVSPLAVNDTYDTVGNTELTVGTITTTNPSIHDATGVFANDLEFNDTFQFLSRTDPTHGTLTFNTDGSFDYKPTAGFTGTDTFTYTITDGGLDHNYATTADNLVDTATVTINVTGQVWYVNNTAAGAGTGTSTDPFQALASAGAAAGAGDTIYVEHGNGTTAHEDAGVTLSGDGERLIGSGVDLTIAGTYNGVSNPTLEAAGTAPDITNTAVGGNAVTATDVIPAEIAGLSIAANNDAIHLSVTNADTGTTSIHDNTVTGAGGDAIKIAHSGTKAWAVDIHNNSLTSTGNAIDIDGSAGTGKLFITDFANNTISGSTGGDGVDVKGATFDSNPGTAGFETVSAGTWDIGASGAGNGVGGNGMVLTNVSGDLSFTDLDIFADNGSALKVVGTGAFTGVAGTRLTVGAGVATLDATGGAAADITSATIDLQLASLASATSAVTGVNLDTVAGTFSAGSTSSISNATGTDFRVNSSNAAVSYNGTISDNVGNGAGISLTGNTGATIAFTGALALSTGTGDAFTATGGGTVTATNTANTLTTTTGTALNVQNTTIGSGNLVFTSISSTGTGSKDAIILDTTGTSGGLHVTGDGSTAGSGGTIANKTGTDAGAQGPKATDGGTGIFLNSTQGVQLAYMDLHDFQNFGIYGNSVNGFTLDHSTVNATASSTATNGTDQNSEGSIFFNELTGTANITNDTIADGIDSDLGVVNTINGSTLTLNVSDSTFTGRDDANLNATVNEVLLVAGQNAGDTPSITANFLRNTMTNNDGRDLQAVADGAASMTINIGKNGVANSGGTFNGMPAVMVDLDDDSSGAYNFNVQNATFNVGSFNTQTGATLPINISGSMTNSSALFQGRIVDNTIVGGNNGGFDDIDLSNIQSGTMTVLVDSNTITNADAVGISYTGATATNLTITNNNITMTGDGNELFGIQISPQTNSTVELAMTGNNVVDATPPTAFRSYDLEATASGATIKMPGYTGNTDSAAATFVAANNEVNGALNVTARVKAHTANGGTITNTPGGAAVPTPTNAQPLLLAEGGVEPDAPPADAGDTTPAAPTDPTDTTTPTDTAGDSSTTGTSSTADTSDGNVNNGILTQGELNAIVAAALQRWEATGLSAEQIAYLQSVTFSISDLSGMTLGSATNGAVAIDTNAAGHGWFIDPTPLGDSEFTTNVGGALYTTPDQAPAGHVDLLTTVMHEMGHELGLSDTYVPTASADVMYGYIVDGERRLPAAGEAAGATTGDIVGQDFLLSTIATLPSLPAGKTVTIEFQSTVDSQSNQFVLNPTAQGSVSTSNGFPTVTTSTNTVTLETLTLGGTVWNDNGAGGGTANDGLKSGTEPGIGNATVTIFADTNNDNVPDGGSLISTTTDVNGNYSFAGLAPGNYLVEVTLPATFTNASAVVAADPDGNVDNDNDGQPAVGGIVSTHSITLDYNTEPTADAAQNNRLDINTTLDIGLIQNQPPVLDLDADDDHGAGTSFTSTFTEGGAAAAIADTDVSVSDPDNTTLKSATITITNLQANDLLTFTANGSTGDIAAGAFAGGVLTLTSAGGATFAAWEAALQAVTYSNASQDPSAADRTIDVTVDDGQSANHVSNTAVATVHVIPVNDPPTLTATTETQTYTEDGSAVGLFSAASISTVEAGQSITELQFKVGNVNEPASEIVNFDGHDVALTDLNSVVTTNGTATVALVGGTATVTWTSAGVTSTVAQTIVDNMTYRDATENPTAGVRTVTLTAIKDSGGTANGGTDTTTLSDASTVTVVPVNDPPVVTAGGASAYTEQAAAVVIDNTVTVNDVDSPDLAGATATISSGLSAGDTLHFTSQNGITGVYSNGVLTLTGSATPADYQAALRSVTFDNLTNDNPSNANRVITWQVDDGSATNHLSNTPTSTLTFTAVNDAPVNTVPSSISAGENLSTAITGLSVSDADAGSANITVELKLQHAGGVLTVLTNVAGGLAAGGIANNGSADVTLTGSQTAIDKTLAATNGVIYAPAANFTGSDQLTMLSSDLGNSGSGGTKTASSTVAITVGAVSAVQTTVLTTDVDGDGIADPGADTVTTTVVITNSSGTNALNTSFNEVLDGMTIVPGTLNVSPLAFNDSYNLTGNTPITITAANGLLANDVEFLGATFGTGPGQTHIQTTGTINTTDGQVVLAADGGFTYTPNTGFTGTDSFTYTLVDAGGLTGTGTATFNVSGLVWYVDSGATSAGADGSFNHPFTSLAPLNGSSNNGATSGDPDNPGDTIFVYNRGTTYTSAKITLENNESFLGDGASLTVNGHTIDGSAGNTSLSDAGGTIITLGSGNTVRGFDLGTASVDITGSNFGTLTIDTTSINNTGTGANGEALDLTTGAFASGAAFSSITSDGGTHNIHLSAVTGTVNLGSSDSLSGASGTSFDVVGGSVSATYTGNISQANNAALVSVTGGHTGTLTFQTGTLSATNGTGLQFDNADGTYDFNGTNTLNGGDAGIDILDGSSGTFSFSSNTSITNPSGTSFNLDSSNANVDYRGSISDNSGYAVDINNADSGTITFEVGSITSTGTGLRVRNSNGGTVNFDDTSIALTTTTSTAVDLSTSNAGDFINFATSNAANSGLVISTTTGKGFVATGGGTVTVTGSHNTISSTGATALDVENTVIGTNGLTFQKISAGSAAGTAADGIILSNTLSSFVPDNSGGLTVTGSASAGSGGTIQNMTGADLSTTSGIGIYLNNTKNVSLAWMNLHDFSNYGIFGTSVNGFTLDHSTVNATASATATNGTAQNTEGSVVFHDLSGTANITNDTLADGVTSDLEVRNTAAGSLLTINVSDSTFTGRDSATLSATVNEVLLVAGANPGDTAGITANFLRNTMTNNDARDLQATNNGTGSMTINIGQNNVANSGGTFAGMTAAQLDLDHNGPGGFNFNVQNATFTVGNFNGQVGAGLPINIFNGTGSGASSLFQGRIVQNTVTGGNNPGGGFDGITMTGSGPGTMTVLVDHNTVSNVSAVGIIYTGAQNSATNTANITITNNTVPMANNPNDSFGIQVSAAASSTAHATVNARIENNSVTGDVAGPSYRVDVRFANSTLNLQGYGGGTQDTTAVKAFIASKNGTTSSDVSASIGIAPSGFFGNVASVTQPGNPQPLLVAPGGVEPAAPPTDDETATDTTPSDSTDTSTDTTQTASDGSTTSTPSDTTDSDNVNNGVLTQGELNVIVAAALERWEATGLTQAQIAYLESVTFSISDLGGLYLGEATNGQVTIDNDAAGHGWFIDATPMSDSEFTINNNGALYTTPDQAAAGHIDLLTTVMHEMGHELGLADNYAPTASGNLMYGFIEDGERRLPTDGLTDGAVLGSINGADFAIGPVSLGTLPAGKSLTIQWQATVDAQSDQLAHNPTNFGSISGSNFSTVVTNTVVTPVDTLTLGDQVFFDADNSGTFNAGDTGVANVALTLFADTNHSGVLDAGDTQIATTVTGGGGLYSFAGLAPGDYIVRVDQSNFNAGGALAGIPVAVPGAVDPDNNVNNDSNGIPIAGNGVADLPITLAYNSEPTNDSTGHGDINNTLDFGFQAVPADQPPVVVAGSTVTFHEALVAGTPVTLEPALSVTDADTPDLASASVRISTGFLTGDQLTFDTALATSLGIVGNYNSGTGLLTFTGSAMPADYQSLLQTVQFLSTSDNPDANGTDTTRQITWTANDGTRDSTAAHTTVDIVAQNDAPSGTDGTITTLEDTTHVFTASDFGFTDPDNNNLAFVEIISTPVAGSLTDNGTAVIVGQFVSRTDIDNGLLQFKPAADANGNNYASFSFKVKDDGGTANGGVDTAVNANTITIDVTSVNDAPTATNESTTIAENTAYTFQATDFSQGFSDPHDSPANNFAGVVITTQSASGTLKLNGATFADGTFIDAAQLGNLTFTPNANFNGDVTIGFEVRDDGGTANGGVDTSSPATFTVHVTPVNQAPTANPDTLTAINEDSGQRTIAFTTLTGNDSAGPANESSQTLTIIDVNNAVGGTVSISGTNVLFTPTLNFNGIASFQYTVQDNGQTNGVDDFKTAVGNVTFTVNAVNDAPVVTLPASYGAQPSVALPINNVTLTDVDENDAGATPTWQVSLSVGAGTLDGAGGNGVIDGVTVTGSHTTSMTLTGSLADLRTYLDTNQKLTFTGTTDTTLSVTLNDEGNVGGGPLSDSTSATISFNAPPVIAGDLQESVLEGGTVVITGLDLSASDPDHSDPSPGDLRYTVTGTTNGQVLLNGVATTTFSEAQLENSNVSFQHDGSETLTASFTVTVTDGGTPPATSAPATVNITVTPVNDPPELDNVTPSLSYTEGNPPTVNVTKSLIFDVDSPDMTSGTVHIDNFFTGDVLGFDTSGTSITAVYDGNGTLTLSGVDTVADYVKVLDSVTYSSTSQNPDNFGTNTARTLEWQVTDKDANGSNNLPSAVATSTVTIIAVDNAPVAVDDAGTAIEAGGTLNATPGSPATGNVILGGAGGAGADSDVDNHVSDLTISAIRTGPEAGAGTAGTVGQALAGSFGKLTLDSQGNYTYVVDDNNATVQALNVGQTLTDTFTYTLQDPGLLTDKAQIVITIQGRNDAPVAVDDAGNATEKGGTNNNTGGSDATGNVITANDSDVDNTTASLQIASVRTGAEAGSGTAGTVGTALQGTFGKLTLNTDGSYDYKVDDTNPTVEALNVGNTLTETFTYVVKDPGGLTDTAQLTITIHGADDAPVAHDDTGTAQARGDFDDNSPATGNVITKGPGADTDVDNPQSSLTVSAIRTGAESGTGTAGTVGHSLAGQFGTLIMKADGSYSYVVNDDSSAVRALNGNQTVTDIFTYTVKDPGGLTDKATLTITIKGGTHSPPPPHGDGDAGHPHDGDHGSGHDNGGSGRFITYDPGSFNLPNGFSSGNSVYIVHAELELTPSSDSSFAVALPLLPLEAPLGGDVIAIDAMLADGSPLPDWLHFDGQKLAFVGTPPAGMVATIESSGYQSPDNIATGSIPGHAPTDGNQNNGTKHLTIDVVARDSHGNIAIMSFTLTLRPGGHTSIDPILLDPGAYGPATDHADLGTISGERLAWFADRDALARAAMGRSTGAHLVGLDQATPAALAGRASLSQQLDRSGWRSMNANRTALLQSLRDSARAWQ